MNTRRAARRAAIVVTVAITLVPSAVAAGDSWMIVPSADSSTTQDNHLLGVACVSASDCWAVGNAGSPAHTLTQHWNGSSWALVASPDPNPSSVDELNAVACVSTDDCWAVGEYVSGSAFLTLAEHWNGQAWTVVSTPNGTTTNSDFVRGVTCASTSDCWMVGWYLTSSSATSATLIEHWDGAAWRVLMSANAPLSSYDFLYGVACTAASVCWAAGYYLTSSNVGCCHQTLIEEWNGSAWSTVSSGNSLPVEDNYLFGVTCASGSECWAVGYFLQRGASGDFAQTLIERWDGTSWTMVAATPNNGPMQPNVLYEASCASPNDCWAVGYDLNHPLGTFVFVSQTLTEHWDGTTWTLVGSPDQNTQDNTLYSVACTPSSDCWAAGDYYTGKVNQTLVEEHGAQLAAAVPESPAALLLGLIGGSIAALTMRVRIARRQGPPSRR